MSGHGFGAERAWNDAGGPDRRGRSKGILIALITLNQVCRFALRRGWLADNPLAIENARMMVPGLQRFPPSPVASR